MTKLFAMMTIEGFVFLIGFWFGVIAVPAQENPGFQCDDELTVVSQGRDSISGWASMPGDKYRSWFVYSENWENDND